MFWQHRLQDGGNNQTAPAELGNGSDASCWLFSQLLPQMAFGGRLKRSKIILSHTNHTKHTEFKGKKHLCIAFKRCSSQSWMLITERPGSGGSGGIPPDLVGSGIQWVPVLVATGRYWSVLVGTGCGFCGFCRCRLDQRLQIRHLGLVGPSRTRL
jgi:hypothetical protein